ncbi:hypothetical protein ElyMa_005769800 [Elysia marginata]|uniref:Uncharacterized protein n=1 Tax=Elysia marginata TaxID=1093978 RepID=A0AAV4FS97_9GAST|nr:hypothetical protein ElyMa_005769800 [Elysia marginata]
MKGLVFRLWIVLALTSTATPNMVPAHKSQIDTCMDRLFESIQTSQVQQETQFIPLWSFYKQRGAYPCYMKGNFHGTFDQALLRNKLRFFDNNVFTTSYVMTLLLEAFALTGSRKPSEEHVVLGIDSFLDYLDKNRPYNHSILSFWPLKYSQTKQFWQANPANTLPYLDLMELVPVKQVASFFQSLGFKDIEDFLEYFYADRKENKKLLFLPPDQDTSSVHIAFGATLRSLRETFPKAWLRWEGRNPRKSTVLEAYKNYSYRPFSGDTDSNSIDPRTYFYLREFLDEAKENGSDVALITTWAQTLTEQQQYSSKGSTMARGINNVCLGVTANAVLGITRALISGLFEESLVAGDPLMRQIYLNSSTLLAYQLDKNLTGRPDLALMYYPTRVQFDWMVSRTVAELESARRRQGYLSPLLQTVYDTLVPSARGSITRRLMNSVQRDSAAHAYYEDFLGAADVSPFGSPIKTGEDRIFCTALAVNTLVNIWTHPVHIVRSTETATHLAWDIATPSLVVETVGKAIEWLVHNSLSGHFKPYGAIFSASYKWSRTLPYRYPGNRYQFLNGTEITPWSRYPPDHLTSYMVRGYIPPSEYQVLLDNDQFGQPVPRDFHGFNADHTKYMWYWDSEPFTYSVSLLALAKYSSILDEHTPGN